MSVFKSAYDTSACAGFSTVKQIDGVLVSLARTAIEPLDGHDIILVDGRGVSSDLIPAFEHPLVFDFRGVQAVAVDVRAMGKYDPMQQQFVVRTANASDFRAATLRGYLQEAWNKDGPDAFSGIGGLPLGLFATWIGEAVAKRLGLEPDEQFSVSTLAAIFYIHLFKNIGQGDSKPEDKHLTVRQINQALGFKPEIVYDHVEAFPVINNVREFCDACKEYCDSTRLRDLNPATLTTIIGGFWYGANARQNIAVALEHPPTWLTIVYLALTEHGFKKSGLTKILERNMFRKQADNFKRQLLSVSTVPDNF